jgi:hypothetical protein
VRGTRSYTCTPLLGFQKSHVNFVLGFQNILPPYYFYQAHTHGVGWDGKFCLTAADPVYKNSEGQNILQWLVQDFFSDLITIRSKFLLHFIQKYIFIVFLELLLVYLMRTEKINKFIRHLYGRMLIVKYMKLENIKKRNSHLVYTNNHRVIV